MPDLLPLLRSAAVAPVVPFDLNGPATTRLDFSAANPLLAAADLHDTADFATLVNQMLAQQGATVGVGGYLEDRIIYRRSHLFESTGPARSLHLGVDVWCPVGTPVHAPLAGIIEGVADNAGFGDYGPTVIVRHELAGTPFWSLYGHLTRTDLPHLRPGQPLAAGEAFATVGPWPENGDWPPHLHFQLIRDLQGRTSDFPGVAVPAERAHWAALCPDPNLVLRSRCLDR